MAGNTAKDELLNSTQQDVGASATKQAVSRVFRFSHEDSLYGVIDVSATGVTVATAVTAILQDSFDGSTWNDKKTVSITADGTFTIKWLPEVAGDQTYLPLRTMGRVVVTTGSGDAVSVTKVFRSFRG